METLRQNFNGSAGEDSDANVHLYPASLLHASRIEKICRALFRSGLFSRVEMIGVQQKDLPAAEERDGIGVQRVTRRHWGGPKTFRKMIQTLDWSRRVLSLLRHRGIKCVNSHSLAVLPLGVTLKLLHGARLVYDTHELETEVGSARGMRRWLYKMIERFFIRWVDDVYVVSDSIADWYARTYGIVRPVVVRNVPELRGDTPSHDSNLWRQRFGIPEGHLIFIYQGGLARGRRIEQLLRVFTLAKEDRHVIFMGYGKLEATVREAAAQHPNIHFAPAVRPVDVLRHTAAADVGLVGVENICLSYFYSLPNKLMEYLLAGLPAVMPNYPEMKTVADATECGWTVGESDEEWLEAVNRLDWSAVNAAKAKASAAAQMYSWQEEERKLVSGYAQAFREERTGDGDINSCRNPVHHTNEKYT